MATTVFYSVCPFGTGTIETGSGTIAISSGVATTSVAQTGNIGIGVCIEYNSLKCYISRVNSSTSFNVITATGGTPANQVAIDITSIHHEYASLSAFEAGFTDVNHINSTNLASSNMMVRACCYYDHVDYTVDSAEVSFAGYDTDTTYTATRYVEAYCPIGGTESINRQKHSGVYDANKYVLEGNAGASIGFVSIADNILVHLTGLQVYSPTYASSYRGCIESRFAGALTWIDSCILRSTVAAYEGFCVQTAWDTGVATMYIRNSIFYDGNIGIRVQGGCTIYIFSSTIVDCTTGIVRSSTNIPIVRNVLIKGCTTNYSGTTQAYGGYNVDDSITNAGAHFSSGDTWKTGTTTGAAANKLIDSGATFITTGVQLKSKTKDSGTNRSYVTALDSETQLSVNDDHFTSSEAYTVWKNMYGVAVFVNYAGDNFLLDATDTDAKNKGQNLYANGTIPVTVDIVENARPSEGNFCVGAFEIVPAATGNWFLLNMRNQVAYPNSILY